MNRGALKPWSRTGLSIT